MINPDIFREDPARAIGRQEQLFGGKAEYTESEFTYFQEQIQRLIT